MKFIFIKRPVHYCTRQSLKKILLIMKLTTFLLMLAFIQVSAKGYGQVTLHEKNAPFEKVMASIRKQTSYTIFYNERIKAGLITVDIDNADIQETLDRCFSNLPITYKIVGNSIFLKEKEAESQNVKPTKEASMLSTSVSGTILSEDKRFIEGVSVFIKGTSTGTLTDKNGYFRLNKVIDNAVLRISCIGYIPVEIGIRKVKGGYMASAIQKEQAGNLRSEAAPDVTFALYLIPAIGDLKGISVNADLDAPKQIGTVVDLKHRSHLNLGQVLEGSVPGLTLKSTTTTNKEISFNAIWYNLELGGSNEIYTGIDRLRELYNKVAAADPTFVAGNGSFEKWYNNWYTQVNNFPQPPILYNTTSTSSSGLVPELRGSSSFTGNTSGMLVVIDGVEQSGFPATYPMNNVAKIEVVKDPVELVKWGPKASGGLILITTNGARAGKLQFNYSSNFMYAAKPNISNSKLQLPTTADVMDYYKELSDKGLASYLPVKPAQLLLFNLKNNNLPYTDAQFVTSWDSLSRLSNREQLSRLYQNVFTQTHSLNIAGGTQAWGFSAGGTYNNSPSTFIGGKTTELQLNLQNTFSLLKNKLNITWQLNTSNTTGKSGLIDNGSSLDPYQMLLDPNNNYVYDYPGVINQDMNNTMQQQGYENFGVNLLEDALNTKNSNKTFSINSRLSSKWELSKGLVWSTAFVYNRNTNNTHDLQGSSTSQVRQLRNDYGSPDTLNGVKMYIPMGGILNTSRSNSMDWNLRSGLSYNHHFDDLNVLTGAFGMTATNTQNTATPNATIYGYSPDQPNGIPLSPFEDGTLYNYYGTPLYLSNLQTQSFYRAFYNRSFSINGNLSYVHDNRYSMNMQYGSVYTPNVGFDPSYSGTKYYEAKASWMVSNEHFFKIPFITTLTFTAIASKIQLAQSPGQIKSNTIAQPLWNNNTLVASGYTPSQQNGQRVSNIGGTLQIGLWQERIYLQASYNHSTDGSHQINGQAVYNIDREPWFNVPFISKLVIDASLQNFNGLQAQAMVMGTNIPSTDGGFVMASGSVSGILPPATINKEVHLSLGMFKDRLIFDTRYYHKVISGTSSIGSLRPDPSTGISSQLSYSRMLNKGLEIYLKGAVVQARNFGYTITINGGYNINQGLDIPSTPFNQYAYYLSTPRTGYANDALWSYRWAGLDNKGNPQVYKDKDTKVPILSVDDANEPITTILDASSLVYSGRTRAPWSGGFIQDWTYKDFFASARLILNLGHIMRSYIPVVNPNLDKSSLIALRWRNPGDEAHTDIAAMAQANPTRDLIIQNSNNSIVSASNIRLSEVQFGYAFPAEVLKHGFIKALTISTQVQNVALWTRNKLDLDPDAISSNGRVGFQKPCQYILSINASF